MFDSALAFDRYRLEGVRVAGRLARSKTKSWRRLSVLFNGTARAESLLDGGQVRANCRQGTTRWWFINSDHQWPESPAFLESHLATVAQSRSSRAHQSALLTRLKRLETVRAVEESNRRLKVEFAHLKPLPREYSGPRHICLGK
jgi:hypothetical protein